MSRPLAAAVSAGILLFTLIPVTGGCAVSPEAPASESTTRPGEEAGRSQAAAPFIVVDTGQRLCSDKNGLQVQCPGPGDALYGQDAQFSAHPPSYSDNGDGTVTDNVTGLIWQKSPDTDGDGHINAADKMSIDEAESYCANLTLAGQSDWRLPDIKELYSLVQFSGTDPSGYEGTNTSGLTPFIDTGYFDFGYGDIDAGERIIDAQYASNTRYVADTSSQDGAMAFGVNFADGRIKGYWLSSPQGEKTFYVLAVRGGVGYGENDFVDNGDGTVSDVATGLMWSKSDSAEGLNWYEALNWVARKNAESFLGYSDWRLPDVKELQSIVDYERSPDTTASAAIDPLFDVSAIRNEAGQEDYPCFWSSTTHLNLAEYPGRNAAYVALGRAMGYLHGRWMDVHGAGAQRSDPKLGDPSNYPQGHGPQGDAIRIDNFVRLVRDA
jgi:hypothetical protein